MFRVGQRVRLARPKYSQNAGLTGVIHALGKWEPGDPFIKPNHILACHADCYVKWDSGDLTPSNTHRLEPLTPPHEACDPEFAESIRRLTDSVPA